MLAAVNQTSVGIDLQLTGIARLYLTSQYDTLVYLLDYSQHVDTQAAPMSDWQ